MCVHDHIAKIKVNDKKNYKECSVQNREEGKGEEKKALVGSPHQVHLTSIFGLGPVITYHRSIKNID